MIELIATYAAMLAVALVPLAGLAALIWYAHEQDKDRAKHGPRPRYPK